MENGKPRNLAGQCFNDWSVDFMEEIEKLWAEFGKLQAQREQTVVQNQAITERMKEIYKKIAELSKPKEDGERS